MNKDKSLLRMVFLIAFGIFFYWLLHNFSVVAGIVAFLLSILNPFLAGLVIAYVLNLPMRLVERRLFASLPKKPRRVISLLVTVLMVLGLLFVVVMMILPELADTVELLFRSMPYYAEQVQKALLAYQEYLPVLEEWLAELNFDWKNVFTGVAAFLRDGAGSVFFSALGVASSVVSGIASFLVSIIFSFYVLLDKEHLRAQFTGICKAYMPDAFYKKVRRIAFMANRIFSQFIAGQCTEAVVIATIFVLVLSVGGFSYALLIGVLVGVLSLIPIFGAAIACVTGALLILISQGLWRALAFVVVFMVVQQLDGNFVYPHIVGNSIGLPPIWVLVAISLGGSLAGMGGMLIFIPIVSLVYALVHKDALRRLRKKGIPSPVAALRSEAAAAKEARKQTLRKQAPESTGKPEDCTPPSPKEAALTPAAAEEQARPSSGKKKKSPAKKPPATPAPADTPLDGTNEKGDK